MSIIENRIKVTDKIYFGSKCIILFIVLNYLIVFKKSNNFSYSLSVLAGKFAILKVFSFHSP